MDSLPISFAFEPQHTNNTRSKSLASMSIAVAHLASRHLRRLTNLLKPRSVTRLIACSGHSDGDPPLHTPKRASRTYWSSSFLWCVVLTWYEKDGHRLLGPVHKTTLGSA
ncbi:hypothetical protein PsorP6_016008 [Peronosclerospora sorghi]|uniref:Uncharacterized protein n=1 Tax=Peronosclerospora sorghi TaxID=230839 RepID=A0ACC0WNY1_9STRA|nr:hypothetical protein PsorP6_016008 [Peronosclerospora sorghi]